MTRMAESSSARSVAAGRGTGVLGVRPVVDPGIRAEDRWVLAMALTSDAAARQLESSTGSLAGTGRSGLLGFAVVAGMVFGVGQGFGAVVESLRSRPPLENLPSAAITVQAMTALSIAVFAFGLGWYIVVGHQHAREERLLRAYRGRYLTCVDFDEPAAQLLARAQYAIDTVTTSVVNVTGAVDRDRNALVLAQEEWDIATALREHTQLRQVHEHAARGIAGHRAAAVLAEQRHTLGLAVQAVAARVDALEHYADQVRAADAVRGELEALRWLTSQDERYRDLLARTAADALSVSQLQDLCDHARQVAAALETDLTTAEAATDGAADRSDLFK